MVGQGGHRGGGHHSHSSTHSQGYTTNAYYAGGAGGWYDWNGTYYYNRRPSNTTVYEGGIDPQQARCSSCTCVACSSFFVFVLFLIIVGTYETPTHFVLDPGDTRVWRYGSSSFTSSLHIIDYSRKTNIYFLESEPTLEVTPTGKTLVHTEQVTLDGGDWLHFNYYLNRNSLIDLSFTVKSGSAHFLLFQGATNFNKWADDADSAKPLVSKYSSNSQKSTLSQSIASNDEYYLVFDNDKPFSGTLIDFSFTIRATQYIMNETKATCNQVQTCDVIVSKDDTRKMIVFSAPESTGNGTASDAQDVTYEIDVYNEPRWSGIVFFWLMVPSTIVLACYLLPAFIHYVKSRSSAAAQSAEEQLANAAVFAAPIRPHAPDPQVPGIELLSNAGFLVVVEAEPYQPSAPAAPAGVAWGAMDQPLPTAKSESTPLIDRSRES